MGEGSQSTTRKRKPLEMKLSKPSVRTFYVDDKINIIDLKSTHITAAY